MTLPDWASVRLELAQLDASYASTETSYAHDLGWRWMRGQLDLAGFPPHCALHTAVDREATICWQIFAMGERGF